MKAPPLPSQSPSQSPSHSPNIYTNNMQRTVRIALGEARRALDRKYQLPVQSGHTMLREKREIGTVHLKTKSRGLNAMLHGGMFVGGTRCLFNISPSLNPPLTHTTHPHPCTSETTEIYGASGSGKTQLCYSLSGSVIEEGGSVLYIDTCNSFSQSGC